MNCEQFDQYLPDYLGDELEGPALDAFEGHVAECARCRRELKSLQDTVAVFGRLEAPPFPVDAPVPRRMSRFQPLAYAAMLVLGLGLGWWIKPAASPVGPALVKQKSAVPVRLTKAWLDEQPAFTRNTYKLVRAFSSSAY